MTFAVPIVGLTIAIITLLYFQVKAPNPKRKWWILGLSIVTLIVIALAQ